MLIQQRHHNMKGVIGRHGSMWSTNRKSRKGGNKQSQNWNGIFGSWCNAIWILGKLGCDFLCRDLKRMVEGMS